VTRRLLGAGFAAVIRKFMPPKPVLELVALGKAALLPRSGQTREIFGGGFGFDESWQGGKVEQVRPEGYSGWQNQS